MGIARILLPKQHSKEIAKARKELPKTPKLAYGRFKDWLRQRSPWLADIWRLRRILKPGMKYGHFEEGQFPKIGKLQNPLIAYLEMVRRRLGEFNKSRLEASTAIYCAAPVIFAKRWKKKCRDTRPAQDDLSLKTGYLQRILDYAFGAQGDIGVLGQRLDQTEVEKFNKEAEIIDYYRKKPEQVASQRQYRQQSFRDR